mmetsp:Transcript_19577/g.58359  ORF Transcript_19577/g.58359 Transcript_19577/m.58359 type:complete len:148 (-) Transcript_19577:1338-1781(-)
MLVHTDGHPCHDRRTRSGAMNNFVADTLLTTRAGVSQTPEAGDQMYELQAVVAHLGNRANSGHYVAVVRSASYWLLYDDRTVQVDACCESLQQASLLITWANLNAVQVVPETFLERLFGMTDAQKANSSWCDTAYILFYGAVRKADV